MTPLHAAIANAEIRGPGTASQTFSSALCRNGGCGILSLLHATIDQLSEGLNSHEYTSVDIVTVGCFK